MDSSRCNGTEREHMTGWPTSSGLPSDPQHLGTFGPTTRPPIQTTLLLAEDGA